MRNSRRNNLIRVIIAAVLLVVCACTFCACHVFAWYIPKKYSDEQMSQIYANLKVGLTDLSHTISSVTFDYDDSGYYYSIFSDEGKTIIRYDVYKGFDTVKRGLYYDGILKEWDVESRTETVTSKDASEYDFLLERIRNTADYFKTEVLDTMPYREDSYCWECFPWGVGMAQMYYLPTDADLSISASWTVETDEETGEFPSIFEAEYHYSSQNDSVWITNYKQPYGIDERIANIQASYQEDKQWDEKMLYKQIYIKGFEDTLTIELYNTEAARALYNHLAEQGDVTVTLNDYGGFEKVGSLGFDLPRNDEQITTDYGDVMLYQGNQIVVFCGQNTWDYTPLGTIGGYSESAFRDVIQAGKGAKQITLTVTNKTDN